ncbi:hypothetical protein PENSOL_c022G00136 [Penicillium solitum]|uniref:Uncharacterized protein n=1 Tax=Penicillium solitum TaxID=60172 RepID=A0A1V6R0T9_9EURO|nr:uncharacterized protein PENSOL_c022G00136 [Penicillium solitum]OQD95080.1 hypothetical protein PENSOL_c022G00136 [Penicillium solitum]
MAKPPPSWTPRCKPKQVLWDDIWAPEAMTDTQTWATSGSYAGGCDGASCTFATDCDNNIIIYDDSATGFCVLSNPIHHDVTNRSIAHNYYNFNNRRIASQSITNTYRVAIVAALIFWWIYRRGQNQPSLSQEQPFLNQSPPPQQDAGYLRESYKQAHELAPEPYKQIYELPATEAPRIHEIGPSDER